MKLEIAAHERPFLPRGVRIQQDRVRGGKVLLAPEKAVALDAIGEAIMQRVNGDSSFCEIAKDLSETFNAPIEQVTKDVQKFLSGLRFRMFISVHHD